jgi:hypothetical protein
MDDVSKLLSQGGGYLLTGKMYKKKNIPLVQTQRENGCHCVGASQKMLNDHR